MRAILCGLMSLVAWAASTSPAEACRCAVAPSRCQAYARVGSAYVADVVSSERVGDTFRMTLRVIRTSPSTATREVLLTSDARSSCGAQLPAGRRYVIYGPLAGGSITACTSIYALDQGDAGPRLPPRTGRVEGRVTVPGAAVWLGLPSGRVNATADGDGHFAFDDVSSGQHAIGAAAPPDLATREAAQVTLEGVNDCADVSLVLHPRGKSEARDVASREASEPQRASDPARAAFMKAHFSEAIVLHDAVARGDLATARTQAVRLAVHRPAVAFPTGAHAFFGLMTIDAGRVRDAKTVEAASAAAATLLARCGQCHAAMRVRSAEVAAPDPTVGGMGGQMLAHQRATSLLLDGLVGPSPASWAAGAREFATLRIAPEDMPSRQLAQKARIANARSSRLAAEAARAVRPPDRARAYGRMLASCARCHQDHPDVWGPRR